MLVCQLKVSRLESHHQQLVQDLQQQESQLGCYLQLVCLQDPLLACQPQVLDHQQLALSHHQSLDWEL